VRGIERALTRFALLGLLILVLVAWSPAAAQALTFGASVNLPVGNAPQSLAVGDFNGDSTPDLAVVNEFSDNVSLLLGGPGGSFTMSANLLAGNHPTSIAAEDFNGDSDLDLAVANYASNNVSVLVGGAGASFTGPTQLAVGNSPTTVATGDFDGDSDPDLAVTNEGTNDVSILLGGAGASFGAPANFPVGSSPQSVSVGRFDGDSDPDLVVSNKLSNDVSVLLGGAGGTFTGPTNFAAGSGPISIAVGRFDTDSDPDLAVTNELSNNVSVLLGGTGGAFSAPTNYAVGVLPDAVALGELNGDSDPDLVVANQASDNISLFLGGAGGSFAGPITLIAGDGPTSVTVSDLNGDSAPDIAVTNEISNNVLILLATPPETTIDAGVSGFTNDSTPTFTFSSNDPSSTFKCRVDGGAFASCTSPHTTATLSNAAHTFEVRATDDAARTDATPAASSFTVDTAAPAAPAVTGVDPASPANQNNPRVKGTAEVGSIVRLYRAATTADCTPANLVATDAAAVFASPGVAAAVADNSTTRFRATATDQAGNVSGCSSSSVTYIEVSPPPVPDPLPPPGGGGSTGGGTTLGGQPAPDTSGPVMAVAGKTVTMDRGGAVMLPLSCPASETVGCQGTVSLDAFLRVRSSAGHSRSALRRVKLGRGSFRVGGGKSAAVKLRLSKKTQRLVRKLKKVRVVAVIDARDHAGNARTTKQALVLKARVRTKR
jgi:VCBS repeat protein/FG-GAP repeat protein